MKPEVRSNLAWLAMPLLAAQPAIPAPAYAQAEPGMHPFVELSYGADDNLLRAAAQPDVTGRPLLSDRFMRIGGGLLFDADISRQHLYARLNVHRTRFDRAGWLNYDGGEVAGLWRGRYGSAVESNLGFTQLRTLTPFSEYRGTERSMRTLRRTYADANWQFLPRWFARAGFAEQALRYSLDAQAGAERDESSGFLALEKRSRAGSGIVVQLQRARGRYVDTRFAPFDYEQDTLEARTEWLAPGRLRLTGVAAKVERRHPADTTRDFSGTLGRIGLVYDNGSKTALYLQGWRDLTASNDVDAAYSINRGLSVQPVWRPTAKLKLSVLAKSESLRFESLARATQGAAQRIDRVRHAALTATFQARPRLAIQAAAYSDRRSSSFDGIGYKARGITFTATQQF